MVKREDVATLIGDGYSFEYTVFLPGAYGLTMISGKMLKSVYGIETIIIL